MLDIFKRFFILGCVAFGGPMAHIALMQSELVEKEKWVDNQSFMDWIGMTQLIPGPNSTEMVMHMGYHRKGVAGLVAAGLGFILPSFSITLVLTILFTSTQDLGTMPLILAAIKPVILAIILMAIYKLGQKTVKHKSAWLFAALAVGLAAYGVSPILTILGVGALGLLKAGADKARLNAAGITGVLTLILSSPNHNPAQIFWPFLKIGSVLYGGGYVLTAFAQKLIVEDLGWLSAEQLLDAIFIGQLTPGPILTAATSMGYMMGGLSGAVAATLGIFLPSFVFVLVLHPIIPKLRKNAITAAFLDAVNAAALGLMITVAYSFATIILTTPLYWGLFVAGVLWLLKKPFGWGALPFLGMVIGTSILLHAFL